MTEESKESARQLVERCILKGYIQRPSLRSLTDWEIEKTKMGAKEEPKVPFYGEGY